MDVQPAESVAVPLAGVSLWQPPSDGLAEVADVAAVNRRGELLRVEFQVV